MLLFSDTDKGMITDSGDSPTIFVDADACPTVVRDMVILASKRRSLKAVFVANKMLPLPALPLLSFEQVKPTPDAADQLIAERAAEGDLVITQDIPLAYILVKKRVAVVSPRGEVFTEENIGDRLSMRDLLQDLRDTGEATGGPSQFGEREKRNFAAAFDRELTRILNKRAKKA